MRLTLLIPSLTLGGAERVLSRLASRWQRDGHDVTLITLDVSESDSYPLDERICRIGLGLMAVSRGFITGLFRNLKRLRVLRSAVVASRPDCVISFIDTMNVMALLASRGAEWSVVISERIDPTHHDPGRFWPVLRRWTYPRCHALVVPGQAVADCFQGLVPAKRTYVIPNPVEPGATSMMERKPWILGVGRLGRQKGFDRLIRSFAELAGLFPEWKLIILGEGPERETLGKLISELQLDGRVRLPGWVDQPDCWYAQAGLFVLPSRYEAFPNALLEAMAAGCACIAVDCPSGPAEIIEDEVNGRLVSPADDDRQLTAIIEELMSATQKRERLGREARGVVQRYHPDRIFKEWETLLHGMMATARESQ